MYLKEAFRYQNFLENLIVSTKLNLSKCNITQTVEEHQSVPSQQKWTQKSFKKRNESYSFFCFRKTAAFIPRFA